MADVPVVLPRSKAILMPAEPENQKVAKAVSNKGEKPVRRSKAEQRAESLDQILDAAEELFSRQGLHGVSMSEVAQKVGVHTTLMHYYFDDKKDLFNQVVRRRAPISVQRRMEALDRYEQECGDHPTVEGALHAFLDSDLDTIGNGGAGWRNFGALTAQINNTPDWGAALMDEMFDAVVLRLIDVLKRAMPGTAEEDVFWGWHFVTGALTLTVAQTGRIDHLSRGLCRSDDFEAVRTRMATFMAAGLLAVCQSRTAQRKASGET
jgi:AcrR family transcriptional regulator